MLERLCEAGFLPTLVLDEASKDAELGVTEQLAALSKVLGSAVPADVDSICTRFNLRYATVGNHNSEEAIEKAGAEGPDLILLGDTRIIKRPLLDLPKVGIINVHPGYLPDVRGNNPYVWAIVHRLNQGVTSNFIDIGVDTGPIVKKRLVNIDGIRDYSQLILKLNIECGEIIVETLRSIYFDQIQLEDQPTGGWAFREAPLEVKKYVVGLLERRMPRIRE